MIVKVDRLQLIPLTSMLLGYAAVVRSSAPSQFCAACVGISLSLLGLLVLEVFRDDQISKQNGLRSPWFILACGFGLMCLGVALVFPVAETLAIHQYLIAERQGCRFDDLEGLDGVGLGMMLMLTWVALPVAALCGLIGAVCSRLWDTTGLGRYALAIALTLAPLISGASILAMYWGRQC